LQAYQASRHFWAQASAVGEALGAAEVLLTPAPLEEQAVGSLKPSVKGLKPRQVAYWEPQKDWLALAAALHADHWALQSSAHLAGSVAMAVPRKAAMMMGSILSGGEDGLVLRVVSTGRGMSK
jgi:hypothetical protein